MNQPPWKQLNRPFSIMARKQKKFESDGAGGFARLQTLLSLRSRTSNSDGSKGGLH